jgi:chromate transporter
MAAIDDPDQKAPAGASTGTWPEVLAAFLKLGLTSFGGPVAHIGYFRAELVERRRWFDERSFVDLVALCQFLPGPASSQVGIGAGLLRAGVPGALAAWTGFTLPSALAMVLFAYGLGTLEGALGTGWLHGLKIAAVAVVAQAVWGMAQSLAPDRPRATLAVLAAVVVLLVPTAWGQVGAIAAGGVIGLIVLRDAGNTAGSALHVPIGRGFALTCLALFFALLAGLPLLAAAFPSQALALVDSFYRSGSLVFGGGHVVLPLLQAEVVPRGWVTNDAFLAGYGAAQAVPGPLFTFAAYLGAVMAPSPNGWAGAALCLGAVFLPSFLLVFGALPFWAALRGNPRAQAALRGINAAVVGLLLAALYRPVWTSAIMAPVDFALAVVAFLALAAWKVPPWLVVVLAAVAGGLVN